MSKTQPIDQEAMDKTTLELFRLSKQFHADYDGWESEVIGETRSKNPSSLINLKPHTEDSLPPVG